MGDDGNGVPAGYSYISAYGAATSFIAYSVSGDVITYKYIDDTNSKTEAEAPLVTQTISLARLEKDYYQTVSQKNVVRAYAAKLKA
nr:hypothetical protein [Lacticaseibacillus zhaodongensis]